MRDLQPESVCHYFIKSNVLFASYSLVFKTFGSETLLGVDTAALAGPCTSGLIAPVTGWLLELATPAGDGFAGTVSPMVAAAALHFSDLWSA